MRRETGVENADSFVGWAERSEAHEVNAGILVKDVGFAARSPPYRAQDEARYPSILEKSATAFVASRISFNSFSRFSRRSAAGTLTVTLSKNAST